MNRAELQTHSTSHHTPGHSFSPSKEPGTWYAYSPWCVIFVTLLLGGLVFGAVNWWTHRPSNKWGHSRMGNTMWQCTLPPASHCPIHGQCNQHHDNGSTSPRLVVATPDNGAALSILVKLWFYSREINPMTSLYEADSQSTQPRHPTWVRDAGSLRTARISVYITSTCSYF